MGRPLYGTKAPSWGVESSYFCRQNVDNSNSRPMTHHGMRHRPTSQVDPM
jgi:hypothetical protein